MGESATLYFLKLFIIHGIIPSWDLVVKINFEIFLAKNFAIQFYSKSCA